MASSAVRCDGRSKKAYASVWGAVVSDREMHRGRLMVAPDRYRTPSLGKTSVVR